MDEFAQSLVLLKRGAKWGDIETYTLEENVEILACRQIRKTQTKTKPKTKILEEGEIDEDD